MDMVPSVVNMSTTDWVSRLRVRHDGGGGTVTDFRKSDDDGTLFGTVHILCDWCPKRYSDKCYEWV
jgi:hypothetical protein